MMHTGKIYDLILSSKQKGKKLFAVLLDPDRVKENELPGLIEQCHSTQVDLVFVGGSLILNPEKFHAILKTIKSLSRIPVLLFPGSTFQVSSHADGILLLSLISGRNPELLIGQHVLAAPYIKASKLEVISTGYILIESGNSTSVSYISNTFPIPGNKPDIASCTALAGEMLGLKLIYLEAGSGATHPVSTDMIKAVAEIISVPLIVGGGINTSEKALAACRAGADIVVIGNALEKETHLLKEISEAVHWN